MKAYLLILALLLVGLLAVMVGLSIVEGDEQAELSGEAWCDRMLDKPNPDWTDDEARIFARDCLYND